MRSLFGQACRAGEVRGSVATALPRRRRRGGGGHGAAQRVRSEGPHRLRGARGRGARAGRLARLSGGQPGVLGQEVRPPHLRRRRLVNLRRSSAGSVMAEAGAQAGGIAGGIAKLMGRRRTERILDCCSCRPAIPPRRKRPPRRAGSVGARRHLAGRISTRPLCGRKRALGSGPGAIGARWPVGTGRPHLRHGSSARRRPGVQIGGPTRPHGVVGSWVPGLGRLVAASALEEEGALLPFIGSALDKSDKISLLT